MVRYRNFITAAPTVLNNVGGRIGRSPAAVRRVYGRGPDSFTNLSVYGFGVAGLWTAVFTVLLQFRVLDFAEEDQKNGMLGAIALAGLVIAALVQPLAGAISDRSQTRWGKRLPYIILGNLGLVGMTPFLGLSGSFTSLLIVVALMQVFGNIAQGPANALLTDHIPRHRRGAGAGALNLARAGGAGLVTVTVMLLMSQSREDEGASGWYWASLAVITIVLLLTTLWTMGSLRPASGRIRRSATEIADPDSTVDGVAKQGPISRTPANALPVSPAGTGRRLEVQIEIGNSGIASFGSAQEAPQNGRGFYWFLIAMAMVVGSLTAMQTFALFFIRDKVGLDNPAAGAAALTVAVGLGAVIAVYPAGLISDRFGRMPVLYSASLSIALASSLLIFVSSISHLVILGTFIGIGSAMFLSSGWALVTELVPQRTAARSLGLTAFATLAGSGLARISGFGIDALNRRSENLGYDALILSIAALLLLSLYPLRRAGLGLANAQSTVPPIAEPV